MKTRIFPAWISLLLIFATPFSSAQMPTRTGKVAEIINVQSYTYMRLEAPDIWLASTPSTITVGEEIKFSGGMEMRNFHSKTLNRTFESIIFVQKVSPVNQQSKHVQGTKIKDLSSTDSYHNSPEPVSVIAPDRGEISPLIDGKSIAEIHEKSVELNSTAVKLRAMVVKVNQNIMGKNWITLEDGTGQSPKHQLRATSSELVSPGDVVIASGMLKTDVDLGSGYKYDALLENATFLKE